MKRWNWVVVGLGALVVVMAGAVALYVDRVREPVADEQALRQAEEAMPPANGDARTDIASRGSGRDHDYEDLVVRVKADDDPTAKSGTSAAARPPAHSSFSRAYPQLPAVKNNEPAMHQEIPGKTNRSQDGPADSLLQKDPYDGCDVVAERVGKPNSQGRYEWVRVFRTSMKYPLVRVVDTLLRQGYGGQAMKSGGGAKAFGKSGAADPIDLSAVALAKVDRSDLSDPTKDTRVSRVEMVADHITVKLAPGQTERDLVALAEQNGGKILRQLRTPGKDTYLVNVGKARSASANASVATGNNRPTEMPGLKGEDRSKASIGDAGMLDAVPSAVANYVKASGTVAYAVPDYIVHTCETIPNDPGLANCWGLKNMWPSEASVSQGANTYAAYPLVYSLTTSSNGVTGTLYFCGYGGSAGDFPSGVSGNIALIQRGNNVSFGTKTANAKNAGAAAVIIYDNGGGTINNWTLGPGNWLPAVAMSQTDGEGLKALGSVTATVRAVRNVRADIEATRAWDRTTGSRAVVVGVIDTGVDYNHPDLAANIWNNPGETGTDANGNDKRFNGIDDDLNGYVDDWHGWDFINNDNDPKDDYFHGTHCAGTIGGVGNNGIGVAGVNWQVSIVPLKFLGPQGGSSSDAIEATYYATKIGVDLTSNSWGGGGADQGLMDAIADAGAHEILFVAAAGNSGDDADQYPMYPAAYGCANIVSVAATDSGDNLASFSNYGASSVDLGAPGVSIYSTFPTYMTAAMTQSGLTTDYGTISGTSMATPHVAGVCALVKALVPGMSAANVKDRILRKADKVVALAGKCVTGGRLNAAGAVDISQAPVLRVANVSAADSGGDGIVSPGEAAELSVTLWNEGLDPDTGVSAVLTTTDPYVTVTRNAAAFGNIGGYGNIRLLANAFAISINASCPTPREITFGVSITDGAGRSWTDSFSIMVYTVYQISGAVTLDSAPAVGVTIAYAGTQSGSVQSGVGGGYTIRAVDGAYELTAAMSGALPSLPVPVSVGPSRSGLNFAFTTATVSGHVKDADTGVGISGAMVSYNGAFSGEVMTGGDGSYAFTRVYGRTATLSVKAGKAGTYFDSEVKSVVVPPSAPNTDFGLSAPGVNVMPAALVAGAQLGQTQKVARVLRIENKGLAELEWYAVWWPSDSQAPAGGPGTPGYVKRAVQLDPFDFPHYNSTPVNYPINVAFEHDGKTCWGWNLELYPANYTDIVLVKYDGYTGKVLSSRTLRAADYGVSSLYGSIVWDGGKLWIRSGCTAINPETGQLLGSVTPGTWPNSGGSWAPASGDDGYFWYTADRAAHNHRYGNVRMDPRNGQLSPFWFWPVEMTDRNSSSISYHGKLWDFGGYCGGIVAWSVAFTPADGTGKFLAELPFGAQIASGPTCYGGNGDIWVYPGGNIYNGFQGNGSAVLLDLGEAPWLSLLPVAGRVPAKSAVDIPVTLDAGKFEAAGVYATTIHLFSNDPRTPEKLVPVTFTVTDGSGNLPPKFETSPTAEPNPGPVGEAVTFNAAASDPNGDALSFTWDFGDGASLTTHATGSAGAPQYSTVSHCYADGGMYKVKLSVSDGRGGTAKTDFVVKIELPDAGLQLYWKLDEKSGDKVGDSTGQGREGLASCGTNDPAWGPGRVHGALSLDGVDDNVTLRGNPVTFSSKSFTVAAWVKVNARPSDTACMLCFGDLFTYQTYSRTHIWSLDNAGNAFFGLKCEGLEGVRTTLPVGQWKHIAITVLYSPGIDGWVDSCIVKAYVNGVQVDSTSTHYGFSETSLGGFGLAPRTTWVGKTPFNGGFDDVRIYDRVLSAAEVAALANVPAHPPAIETQPTATPNPVHAGQAVRFDVTASDPNGDTLSYAWDFGDGMTAVGKSPAYVYQAAGTYEANVTVSDGNGGEAKGYVAVMVSADSYTIMATAGEGGTITPSGAVTVNHGGSMAFTPVPKTGYRIQDVKVDGRSIGAVTNYTFVNVTASHAIEAVFKGGSSDLVAYWKLDDGSGGIALDSSGNGYDGTLTNGAVWRTTGRFGGSLEFPVVNSAMNAPLPVGGEDNFSYSFWINVNSQTLPAGGYGSVGIYRGKVDGNYFKGFELEVDYSIYSTTGPRCFWVFLGGYTGSSWIKLATVTWTLDQWFHVALTASPVGDKTVWRLYKDGSLAWTSEPLPKMYSWGDGKPPTDIPTWFGQIEGYCMPHTMDDIRVYDRVLTADEVAELARGGLPNLPPCVQSGPTATPNPAGVGAEVSFSVTASDPENDPMTYAWSFGDGVVGNGAIASHAYAASGSYTSQVTVADDKGNSATRSLEVSVVSVFYTITATAGTGGTITPVGTVSVGAGANQSFAITPNLGYVIDVVTVDGVSQGAIPAYVFNKVSGNHTIAASFRAVPIYTLTATAGTGGTISPAGAIQVTQGGSKAFAIAPSADYLIADVTVDGVSVGAVSLYTFTNVTANHTIAAVFAPLPSWTITATVGAHGTISPAGAILVKQGKSQKFTVTADTGYTIQMVLVDGVPLTRTVWQVGPTMTHTFESVAANHTISATFEDAFVCHWQLNETSGISAADSRPTANTGTLQAGAAWAAGKLAGGLSLDGTDDYMTTAKTIAWPMTKWSAAMWFKTTTTHGGMLLNNGEQQTGMNHRQLYGDGQRKSFQLFMRDSGRLYAGVNTGDEYWGGGETDAAYNDGKWHHVAVTLDWGHYLEDGGVVYGDGLSIWVDGVQVKKFPGIQYAMDWELYWRVGYDRAALHWEDHPEHKLPTSNYFQGAVDDVRLYRRVLTAEELVALTRQGKPVIDAGPAATPNPVWAGNAVNFSVTASGPSSLGYAWAFGDGLTGSGAAPSHVYTTGGVTYPAKVTVSDAGGNTVEGTVGVTVYASNYTVTATAGAGGSMSPAGTVIVPHGQTQAFAITPAGGYQIGDVKVDGVSLGTISSYTFVNVTANHTIEARFAPEGVVTYTVTVNNTGSGTGQVALDPPGGVYAVGTVVKLTATADSGSLFSSWTGDVGEIKDNPTGIVVDGNKSVTATFIAGSLTVTADGNPKTGVAPFTARFKAWANGGVWGGSSAGVDTTDDGLGTVTAQGEHASGEVARNAFDNDVVTRWRDYADAYPDTRASWIQYAYPDGQRHVVSKYSIQERGEWGNGDAYRWPSTWKLLGSNDGGANWTEVDYVQGNDRFMAGSDFTAKNPGAYAVYRLQILSVWFPNPTYSTSVQIDELEFREEATYEWDFGDGTTGTGANPGHVYGVPGNYTARVTTRDAAGNTASATVPVTVGGTQNYYTIAASANALGTITPDGQLTVAGGSSQAFAMTPCAGYGILDVKVDGVSSGAVSSYIFNNVQANHTIKATFGLSPLSAAADGTPLSGAAPLTVAFAAAASGGTSDGTGVDTTDDGQGTVTAQGETGPGEGKLKAFDNNAGSKWRDYCVDHTGTRSSWIQYAYTSGQKHVATRYTITSSDGSQDCDPLSWNLLGSNDAGATWAEVDGRGAVYFTNRLQKQEFAVADPGGYAAYKLRITCVRNAAAVGGNADSMQLGELELIETPPKYTYAWDFGDGATGTGANPSHTYASNGIYRATVTVCDGVGATANASVEVNVGGATRYYTITATAGALGSITPAGNVTVAEGTSQTFWIAPNTGYAINDVKVDGVSVGAVSSYTFSNVTANHTIEATFGTAPLSAMAGASPRIGGAPLTVAFTAAANGGTAGGAAGADTTDDQLGTVTAQGENLPNEGMLKAFDNNSGTKWLDFANANPSTRASWIQYAYASGAKKLVSRYTLTSANDAAERDPRDWKLLGSNDGGATWTELDSRTGEQFTARAQKKEYTVSSSGAYAAYKLQILSVWNPSSANSIQLAEIELLEATAPYTYAWDFGDGQTSSVQNPNHTYSVNGVYTATVTVTDGVGATASSAARILVGPQVRITDWRLMPGSKAAISWDGPTGVFYRVQTTTNLRSGFAAGPTNRVWAASWINCQTVTVDQAAQRFYRMVVEP